MIDPLGCALLLLVGLFAVTLAVVGIQRGRCVGVMDLFRPSRSDRPILFWYGIAFQSTIGVTCLVLAVVKLLD